jgi:hypothetical protein
MGYGLNHRMPKGIWPREGPVHECVGATYGQWATKPNRHPASYESVGAVKQKNTTDPVVSKYSVCSAAEWVTAMAQH